MLHCLGDDENTDRYCSFTYNPSAGGYDRQWIRYADDTYEPVRNGGSLSSKWKAGPHRHDWWHETRPAQWRPWEHGFGFSWNHHFGEENKPRDWGRKSEAERAAGDAPYFMDLETDDNGRILARTERIDGRRERWEFRYDEAGRLTGCVSNTGWCQDYAYEDGKREHDSEIGRRPLSRTFRYDENDRLLSVGDTTYEHDENGFRSAKTDASGTTYYRYSPDYRLLGATLPDGREIEYEHNKDGLPVTKKINGLVTARYVWKDFIRLASFHDGEYEFCFTYEKGERLPHAVRVNGRMLKLEYDQVGTLKAVVGETGNVIQAIQYDPFGKPLWTDNQTLHIPLGFAGGLEDPDTGFVRFGWRDYDPDTGRWTALDPIGDAGGDDDWYGYCLDDPVNGVDPLGLEAKWASRPLDGAKLLFGEGVASLMNKMIGKTSPAVGLISKALEGAAQRFDDEHNIKFEHRHMFLGDKPQTKVGTSKASEVSDRGFTKKGLRDHKEERKKKDYVFDKDSYDEDTMLQAVGEVKGSFQAKDYNLPTNPLNPKKNCQDAETAIKKKYKEIWRDQILEKGKQWFGR